MSCQLISELLFTLFKVSHFFQCFENVVFDFQLLDYALPRRGVLSFYPARYFLNFWNLSIYVVSPNLQISCLYSCKHYFSATLSSLCLKDFSYTWFRLFNVAFSTLVLYKNFFLCVLHL